MSAEKKDFDKEASSWDQESRRVKLANDVADAMLKELQVTSDMDVMDFGCGTGLLTLRLQPLVRTITGVDSSQGMLDVLQGKIEASALHNVKLRCLALDEGGSLEGSYHVIVSSMTFHHILDLGAILRGLYDATLPGGTLCIADLDLDEGQFHPDPQGVFHDGFDRQAIRKAFSEAGYVGVHDRTAAEVVRTARDGQTRRFTIFLMIGHKP